MIGPAVRVDAADICHVFEPRFAGQVRGISWLTPVATSILELDATQDAAIMKAKVTALMCGFIRNLEGGPGDDLAEGELSLEPGVLRRLRAGEEVHVHAHLRHGSAQRLPRAHGALDQQRRRRALRARLRRPRNVQLQHRRSSALEAFKRRCRAIRPA